MNYLTNYRGENAGSLAGMYRGASCFLVCGGPSVRSMNLSPLRDRGILIAAVNNVAAATVRPHLWFSYDDTPQFHENIWTDPGILKFCREDRLTHTIKRWDAAAGQFLMSELMPRDCPAVFGYKSQYGWDAAGFLTERFPTAGTESAEADPEGRLYHRSVMLIAFRLLYDLGIRKVYLLGCDFQMDAAGPYCFEETRTPDQVESNNGMYGWLDRRFREVRPYFDLAKFKVWNCTPGGRLTSFERMEYIHAVKREGYPYWEMPQTKGHYHG